MSFRREINRECSHRWWFYNDFLGRILLCCHRCGSFKWGNWVKDTYMGAE